MLLSLWRVKYTNQRKLFVCFNYQVSNPLSRVSFSREDRVLGYMYICLIINSLYHQRATSSTHLRDIIYIKIDLGGVFIILLLKEIIRLHNYLRGFGPAPYFILSHFLLRV